VNRKLQSLYFSSKRPSASRYHGQTFDRLKCSDELSQPLELNRDMLESIIIRFFLEFAVFSVSPYRAPWIDWNFQRYDCGRSWRALEKQRRTPVHSEKGVIEVGRNFSAALRR
jgi:hypothetical protein